MSGMLRRRRSIRLAGALLVVLVGCSSSGDPTAGGTSSERETSGEAGDMEAVSVVLPDYPFWATDTIVEDQATLDELAAAYAAERPGEELEMERFLYGSVPVTLFEQVFSEPLDEIPIETLLWLFHISGYFGGLWLRGEIVTAQPDAAIAGASVAPTEEDFRAAAASAAEGVAAATGSPEEVSAYNELSLFGPPEPPEGFIPPGLVGNFGYNEGYMLQILEVPPEGLDTPAQYGMTCDGPFGCTYVEPKLVALEALQGTQQALANDPAYADLAARILPLQDTAVEGGRAVWSGGLSVQGFPQNEYDQLLDVSSTYLQEVQATGLATVRAIVDAETEIGRRAAIATAAIEVWLAGYAAGLVDGRPDREVPRFDEG